MSVTNYTLDKCKYIHSKLKNVLYLVSAEHVKDVHIDTGEAYIEDLSETPLRINGFNIQYSEETSLDERYKFDKKITLSMKGYVNYKQFEGKYYAIIEDNDGVFYMINVDFPSRITHTFNLSQNVNQTDFTFHSFSNFPTIKLNSSIASESLPCVGYNVYGIKSLQLINKDYARLDIENEKIKITDRWQDVEFIGESCSFQEVYDGEILTDTITFQIPLNHKIGWSWNLLEFLDNLYASTIVPKGGDNVYYSGFNFGLQPSYSIQTSSRNGESDIITVTLIEKSNYGATAAVNFTEQDYDTTSWRYVKWVGNIKGYECVGYSRARYLLQQEVDAFGNPTGVYKVREGYQSQYPMLNTSGGTFTNEEDFNEITCAGDNCIINTTIPDVIVYSAATCNTYTLSASCDWYITGLANYLTASPISGNANQSYSVSICNTSTQISGQSSTFNIQAGNNIRIINVELLKDSFINPVTTSITCANQDVEFSFSPSCPVTVHSIDSRLTYEIGNSTLTVNVPANLLTTSEKVWTIEVRDCDNRTVQLRIIQDKVYERWVDSGFYVCVGGNSYKEEVRYTGETADNINHITTEKRPGELIEEGDSRCNKRMTKWEWVGNYYCVNGNKQKAIEQFESYDNGITWTKTGLTQLGETVEYDSEWCDIVPEYDWRLTEKWQCGDGTEYTFEYCDGRKFYMQDVPNSGGTYEYCITSIAGSEDIEYNVTSICDWVSIDTAASSMTVNVQENTDPTSDRECVVFLHQRISGKQIALNVLQAAGASTCDRLLDSCCGASVASGDHPDCDIELGRSGGTKNDGVLDNARVRLVTTSLPSWLEVENHDTYVTYKAVEDNTSTSNRYFTVEWEKVSGTSAQCDTAETIVKQLGGAAPRPYVFTWQNGLPYIEVTVDANAGVIDKNVISTYNGEATSFTASNECDWVNNVYSATNTNFKVAYGPNSGDTSRTCIVELEQAGSHAIIRMEINQSASGAPGETYIRWGDNLHPSVYSATTTWNGTLTLVPFYSLLNGVETNAVLSTDTNWIQTYNQLYYNYTEVKPNRNETIYLNPNTSTSPRTGLLTLTQKGGTDFIQVYITQGAYVSDCSITSFSIPDSVCQGEALNYEYTVADARCDRTFYFNVFDSYGGTFTSTSSPTNGRGSGTFDTSGMATGTAQMSVVIGSTATSKEIAINSCGGTFRLIGDTATTTTWNGTVSVMFQSNINGEDVNAVMTSNVSWIKINGTYYTNNNELRPGINNTVYLDNNTSLNPRTGTLTLTQKGSGRTLQIVITQGAYVPDCRITSFAFTPGDVCKGSESVEFNFTMADNACTTTQNFNLLDADGNMFTTSVTPSNGSGSGSIATAGMALGTAGMTVLVNNVATIFEKEIIDCGGGESYWDTGLPVVVINTPNGQPITSKEVWMEGAEIKIYKGINNIVYQNNALSIRGRGNSSWVYSDKKPYALKLENKAEILGMAKSKRWALLANYADRILMRNRIVNEIAQCTDLTTGMGWSPMGEFVELVLNGEHRGNYYLSEQVRVESKRLDIDEYSDCLYEIDRNDMTEDYTFRSAIKDYPYHIKSPDVPDFTTLKGKIDTIETLLNSGSGYEPYLDYNSFADYWIVEELCQNFEVRGHSPGSVYCYWLADNSVGKLKMGPPWDFDYSTFNLYWPLKANGSYCSGTTVPANGYMPNTLVVSCAIYYDWLFNDSEFKAVVKQRWNAIKYKLDAILNRFDYWYNKLYASEQLNWALWPIPPDFESGHHPDASMTFLEAKNSAKSFYSARLTYLNNVINGF